MKRRLNESWARAAERVLREAKISAIRPKDLASRLGVSCANATQILQDIHWNRQVLGGGCSIYVRPMGQS